MVPNHAAHQKLGLVSNHPFSQFIQTWNWLEIMPKLLDSFDLPSFDLESRSRYTLRLLLMCPGEIWKLLWLEGEMINLGEWYALDNFGVGGNYGICGALRDLAPFVQFEKREKHPRRSVNFSN